MKFNGRLSNLINYRLKKAKSMMNADNFAWFAYYAEHPDGDGGYWSD